ncbi:MAG: MerR family transcriptional regulator [Lachnospiraceae bacterium]|nr:MerR family transcriptional regulator [Lachnospiraceae bacterium]
MKLNRCKYCGEMFQSPHTAVVCKDCRIIDEALFTSIEEYLKKYPNSNAIQISEGLEISVYEIIRFIDEGRLQFSKGKFERLK